MPYRIAGIDVHKKRLAVVVADVEFNDEEFQFEQRWYVSTVVILDVILRNAIRPTRNYAASVQPSRRR
jgi:hypothetical protein